MKSQISINLQIKLQVEDVIISCSIFFSISTGDHDGGIVFCSRVVILHKISGGKGHGNRANLSLAKAGHDVGTDVLGTGTRLSCKNEIARN